MVHLRAPKRFLEVEQLREQSLKHQAKHDELGFFDLEDRPSVLVSFRQTRAAGSAHPSGRLHRSCAGVPAGKAPASSGCTVRKKARNRTNRTRGCVCLRGSLRSGRRGILAIHHTCPCRKRQQLRRLWGPRCWTSPGLVGAGRADGRRELPVMVLPK